MLERAHVGGVPEVEPPGDPALKVPHKVGVPAHVGGQDERGHVRPHPIGRLRVLHPGEYVVLRPGEDLQRALAVVVLQGGGGVAGPELSPRVGLREGEEVFFSFKKVLISIKNMETHKPIWLLQRYLV